MLDVSFQEGRREAGLRQAAAGLVLAALGACLSGCGHSPLDPAVDLFHDLEGGRIAEVRPPPPGVDAPYPNLGAIPPRPVAPDIPQQQKIADQLAAQRDASLQDAAKSPLAPPAPAAAPKPQAAVAAAPDPNLNRVVVDAAPALAAAQGSASGGKSAPAADLPALSAVPAVPELAASGPMPALAGAPPALPANLGLTVPPPPSASTPVAAPAVPAPPANTVAVAFTPGSAELPPSATLNLRRFALAHRGGAFTVTGHGDAVMRGADSQSRALDLALRRAQSIAASLAAAGVPAASLHLHAEAAGQGGTASL